MTALLKKLTVALAVALLAAGCSLAPQYVDYETFTASILSDAVKVKLDIGVGDIEFIAGDTFGIEARKHSYNRDAVLNTKVAFSVVGDTLTVTVESVDDSLFRSAGMAAIDFVVTLPSGVAIGGAESEVGDIVVRGMEVPCNLRTAVGDIRLLGSGGELTAGDLTASTGDILVRGYTKVGLVNTRVGQVRLESVGSVGGVTVSTGDIYAELDDLPADTRLAVSTGDIILRVDLFMEGFLNASNLIGDIDLNGVTLNPGDYDLTLFTSTGDIEVDYLER